MPCGPFQILTICLCDRVIAAVSDELFFSGLSPEDLVRDLGPLTGIGTSFTILATSSESAEAKRGAEESIQIHGAKLTPFSRPNLGLPKKRKNTNFWLFGVFSNSTFQNISKTYVCIALEFCHSVLLLLGQFKGHAFSQMLNLEESGLFGICSIRPPVKVLKWIPWWRRKCFISRMAAGRVQK